MLHSRTTWQAEKSKKNENINTKKTKPNGCDARLERVHFESFKIWNTSWVFVTGTILSCASFLAFQFFGQVAF